jgi:hypothetical protein
MADDDLKKEKKARQAADAKLAWDEYNANRAAVEKNTERLRALRLAKEAREAAAPPKPAKKAKARKK